MMAPAATVGLEMQALALFLLGLKNAPAPKTHQESQHGCRHSPHHTVQLPGFGESRALAATEVYCTTHGQRVPSLYEPRPTQNWF